MVRCTRQLILSHRQPGRNDLRISPFFICGLKVDCSEIHTSILAKRTSTNLCQLCQSEVRHETNGPDRMKWGRHPASSAKGGLRRTGRFEPARAIAHWILNPARLPIHLEREPPNLLEVPQNTCGCAQSVPTLAGLSNGHRETLTCSWWP